MMAMRYPRRLANFLLRYAVAMAPYDSIEWGHAMLCELSYVKGDWAALMWAIGGTSVLAKRAFLSLIIPRGKRRYVSFAEDFFAKEGSMRKTVMVAIGTYALACLFFVAPAFRQAFRVSLVSWDPVIQVASSHRKPNRELKELAQKAERDHDAEALVFAAVRQWDVSESARLADEAVQMDPKLIWVYVIVAVINPRLSEIDRWLPKVEQWDPQNALPHFIKAESIDIDEVLHEQIPQRVRQQSRGWLDAMTAAFGSPKIDNYHEQLKELDRRVLLRYRFNDPYQIRSYESWYGLPSYAAWDSSRYAQTVFESAGKLEDRGDRGGALEKYWAVARFGQMMGSAGGFTMRQVVRDAYKQLGILAEKEGRHEEAAFYASLAVQVDRAEQEEENSIQKRLRGSVVSRWNAFLVRASGLMMLFSVVLVLTCALTAIARGRSLRLSSLRITRSNVGLALSGALGSLLFSAMLYMSYKPYAEILQRFIGTGDDSRLPELSEFLTNARSPLGAVYFKQLPDFVFYFWVGVTALCVAALVLVAVRHYWNHPRTVVTT